MEKDIIYCIYVNILQECNRNIKEKYKLAGQIQSEG